MVLVIILCHASIQTFLLLFELVTFLQASVLIFPNPATDWVGRMYKLITFYPKSSLQSSNYEKYLYTYFLEYGT